MLDRDWINKVNPKFSNISTESRKELEDQFTKVNDAYKKYQQTGKDEDLADYLLQANKAQTRQTELYQSNM
jgi:hypothetical protein